MKRIIYMLIIGAAVGCTGAKNNDNSDTAVTVQAINMDTQAVQEAYKRQVDSTYKPAEDKPKPQEIENIPYFRILTTDSVYVTQAVLKKDKPVMIVYFSPDCSHCTKFLDELKPKLKELSALQIVMVTWIKYPAVKKYYDDYGFKAYKNIIVGTEGDDLLVQQYYKVKETPYFAIYNHYGKLIKVFDKVPKVDDLLAAAKKA
ncbi:MAG: hypothetical protein EOP54_26375 [Sphingobacteriales bacterium]|nr:MAG: hypothetical protein EOP54_26375 [Sphingobacteriales bacterium]